MCYRHPRLPSSVFSANGSPICAVQTTAEGVFSSIFRVIGGPLFSGHLQLFWLHWWEGRSDQEDVYSPWQSSRSEWLIDLSFCSERTSKATYIFISASWMFWCWRRSSFCSRFTCYIATKLLRACIYHFPLYRNKYIVSLFEMPKRALWTVSWFSCIVNIKSCWCSGRFRVTKNYTQ